MPKPPGTKRSRRIVAALFAQGYAIQEIAMRTHLRPPTVRRILDHQRLARDLKNNHRKEA